MNKIMNLIAIMAICLAAPVMAKPFTFINHTQSTLEVTIQDPATNRIIIRPFILPSGSAMIDAHRQPSRTIDIQSTPVKIHLKGTDHATLARLNIPSFEKYIMLSHTELNRYIIVV